MTKVTLHVSYLPNGGVVLPILSAINAHPKSRVRALSTQWKSSGLGQMGASLSTKITMLSTLTRRLYSTLTPMVGELAHGTDVAKYLKGNYGWLPAHKSLPYELLVDLDSFIFEFRSAYEIFGKFLVAFGKTVLGRTVKQSEFVDYLKAKGAPTDWIELLRKNRVLLFHEQAPWLAFKVAPTAPFDPEIVFLADIDASPDDRDSTLSMKQLGEIYGGLDRALQELQQWALDELAKL